MGKRTAFSLPGFVRLAPSIHVQDPQASAAGYQTGADTFFASSSSSSQSSYSLPPDFGPEIVYPSSSSSSFSGGPSGPRRPYPLSGQSSFVLPRDTASSRGTAPPDLIVITSWTGAAARHVAKYTDAYNKLYPGVPVLVITTVIADFVLHSERHKLRALQPAVDYLLSTTAPGYDAAAAPPLRFRSLLLHAFSEGGAHKAVLLAKAYLNHTTKLARNLYTHTQTHHPSHPYNTHHQSNPHNTTTTTTTPQPKPPRKLPVSALLLDSTPGRASYRRATTGMARSLPHPSHPVTRALGPPLAASVIGAIWVGQRLRGKFASEGSLIEETRRALNDAGLWDLRGCARTYLFGVGDEVVGWRDVEDHAVESAGLCSFGGEGGGSGRSSRAGSSGGGSAGEEEMVMGGPAGCLMVKFRGTQHCAHAKGEGNGEVYWAAVRKTWEMRADGGLGLRLGLGRRLSLDSLCGEGEDEGRMAGGW